MAKGGGAGQAALLFLVLAALVGGYGTWNYRRNVAAEEAEYRPFGSYSGADLEALAQAYEQEVDAYAKRWERATGQKVAVRNSTHFADKVSEFERVQRIGRATRTIARELAKRQVALEQVREEQAHRAGQATGIWAVLKKAFVYES